MRPENQRAYVETNDPSVIDKAFDNQRAYVETNDPSVIDKAFDNLKIADQILEGAYHRLRNQLDVFLVGPSSLSEHPHPLGVAPRVKPGAPLARGDALLVLIDGIIVTAHGLSDEADRVRRVI